MSNQSCFRPSLENSLPNSKPVSEEIGEDNLFHGDLHEDEDDKISVGEEYQTRDSEDKERNCDQLPSK